MNHRLRDMLAQAGLQWPHDGEELILSRPSLEKFADTVVKECIKVARNANHIDSDAFAGDAISAHFGVAAYTLKPITSFGDLFTVKEFAEDVKLGCLIPYDGDGYWATQTEQSDLSVWVTPRPDFATHVMWYNR